MDNILWSVPDRVLLYTMPEVLTIEGIEEVDQIFNQFLDESSIKLHIIADNTFAKRIPLDMPKVIKAHTYTRHANLGWIIVVNAPKMIQFASTIMNQTFTTRYRFAPNLETAVTFLQEYDETLENLEFKLKP